VEAGAASDEPQAPRRELGIEIRAVTAARVRLVYIVVNVIDSAHVHRSSCVRGGQVCDVARSFRPVAVVLSLSPSRP
jgi:hypothetical protein